MKLDFDSVSAGYKKKSILEQVSLSVPQGQITALIGRNGAGKSTLIRCLTGGKQDYLGAITIDGKNVRSFNSRGLAKQIACLPQELPRPRVTVKELVSFGRAPYIPITGRLSPRDEELVEKAILDGEISHLKNEFVDCLSGGERKKAFFAMVLAQNTPVVVLDEPTAHLDMVSRFAFLELVEKICRAQNKTFLVVMHDLPDVLRFADNVVVLHENRIVFTGAVEDVLRQKIPETCFGITLTGNRETGFAATPTKE